MSSPIPLIPLLSFMLLLLLSLPSTTAQATCRNNNTLPLASETIFQFAPGNNFTFFENIAARSNGDLLITMAVPQANLFLLQNAGSSCPTLVPLLRIPDARANGTDGLVEIATRPDVFAVIAGSLSLSGNPANGVPGSWAVWEVDLAGTGVNSTASGIVDCTPGHVPEAPIVTARKIADFPQAPRLNGAAAVPNTPAVLVGDSQLGVVFRLDTVTGAVAQVMDLAEMKPVPNAGSADDALGLNGMKIKDGFLYFTNAAARTINRVAILMDGSGIQPGAVVQRLGSVPESGWMDDLDLREDGSLWVTTNSPTNSLLAIEPTTPNSIGAQAQFNQPFVALGAPNTMTIPGSSAAVFGRGTAGSRMLYVTTGSGLEPAKIVRVNTSSCL